MEPADIPSEDVLFSHGYVKNSGYERHRGGYCGARGGQGHVGQQQHAWQVEAGGKLFVGLRRDIGWMETQPSSRAQLNPNQTLSW